MNELQNMFLGCMAAVRITKEEEFDKLKEWMSINNLFLLGNEPVVKMKYPGDFMTGIARDADSMCIYWCPIVDIDEKIYKICSVKDFFKDEKAIDVNVKETSETIEVTKEMLSLVVDEKPRGDIIESNIDNILKLIPSIESKKNVIVTKDNYKDFTKKGDGLVPSYRKQAKDLKDSLKAVKDNYMQPLNIFTDKVKQVINALESTAQVVDENCKVFENERKEALRKERMVTINQLKEFLITKEMISKKNAEKFVFDEKWLNVSCSTKKFKEEVEKQFQDLINQEKIVKQNMDMIEKTIINQCQLSGLDHTTINRDKYIAMANEGKNLGDIVTTITTEIEAIKKNTEAAIKKAKDDYEKEKQHALDEQQRQFEAKQKANEESQSMKYVDSKNRVHTIEKTGEVYAVSSDDAIKIKRQPMKGDPNKIYSYQYTFEGDCAAIMTFNRFLKALSEVYPSFKYESTKSN